MPTNWVSLSLRSVAHLCTCDMTHLCMCDMDHTSTCGMTQTCTCDMTCLSMCDVHKLGLEEAEVSDWYVYAGNLNVICLCGISKCHKTTACMCDLTHTSTCVINRNSMRDMTYISRVTRLIYRRCVIARKLSVLIARKLSVLRLRGHMLHMSMGHMTLCAVMMYHLCSHHLSSVLMSCIMCAVIMYHLCVMCQRCSDILFVFDRWHHKSVTHQQSHDSFIYVTWLVLLLDVPPLCVQHMICQTNETLNPKP